MFLPAALMATAGDAGLRSSASKTKLSFLRAREHDLSAFGGLGFQRRYYFHLEFRGEAPDTWWHYETDPSDGSPEPIAFEFFWVRLPHDVPELSGGQGELLASVEVQ